MHGVHGAVNNASVYIVLLYRVSCGSLIENGPNKVRRNRDPSRVVSGDSRSLCPRAAVEKRSQRWSRLWWNAHLCVFAWARADGVNAAMSVFFKSAHCLRACCVLSIPRNRTCGHKQAVSHSPERKSTLPTNTSPVQTLPKGYTVQSPVFSLVAHDAVANTPIIIVVVANEGAENSRNRYGQHTASAHSL